MKFSNRLSLVHHFGSASDFFDLVDVMPRAKYSMNKIRQWLAFTLIALVVVISLIATFAPRGEGVLRLLLPALMLVLGYYFGRKPKASARN